MKRLLLLLVAALAIAACGPAGTSSDGVDNPAVGSPTTPLDSTMESLPADSGSPSPE